MDALLAKLNYKGQKRIAVINAPGKFIEYFKNSLKDVRIDKEIDPRFPYEFLILFVSLVGMGAGQSVMFAILPTLARVLGLTELQASLPFVVSWATCPAPCHNKELSLSS